jgi:hypothetical protein
MLVIEVQVCSAAAVLQAQLSRPPPSFKHVRKASPALVAMVASPKVDLLCLRYVQLVGRH